MCVCVCVFASVCAKAADWPAAPRLQLTRQGVWCGQERERGGVGGNVKYNLRLELSW